MYALEKKNPNQFLDKIESAARLYDGTPIKNSRQQTKALKMMNSALGAYAYYKGTSIRCVFEEEDLFVKMCIDGAKDQIANMLRGGASLKQIGIIAKIELDKMEEQMCQGKDAKKPQEFSGKDYLDYLSNVSGKEISGVEFMSIWYINIAVLLKLKVIDNDEMNGWLIMKQK